MILDLSDLPADPEQLKGKLIELASAAEEAAAQRDAVLEENEKLLFILAEFKRALFGRRSEKLDPDQLQLIFDLATAASSTEGAGESPRGVSAAASKKPRKPAERNRGKLPEHLPRIEIRIDPEDKTCNCCGGSAPRHRRDGERDARHRAGAIPGQAHYPPALWLPGLRERGGPGARAGAAGRRRHRHRSAACRHRGCEIRLASAAEPPVAHNA